MNKTGCLVVIAGPTAIGKTALTIKLASHFHAEIISADSRQFYRELVIGSAMPDEKELAAVPHHLIASHSIHEQITVADFEKTALSKLGELFKKHKIVFMTGGSGLFIDAVCKGMDELPEVDPEIRKALRARLETKGLEDLASELILRDPGLQGRIDLKNPHRVLRALEIMESTGKKVSELRTGKSKERPFNIIKILLDIEREELYKRINERVDEMVASGLLKEAENLFPFRHFNALQTVGYKELFSYFEGSVSLDKAIDLIRQNTRRYAKRQLTWFRNDKEYKTFSPVQEKEIIGYIESCCVI